MSVAFAGAVGAGTFPGANGVLVGGDPGTFELVTLPATGGGTTPLADGRWPSWNGAGTQVVFQADSGSLSVIDADGSNETAIPNTVATDREPSFSPDGTRVAFRRSNDIFVIDVDGSNLVQVTTDGNTQTDAEPAWSPDGSQLVLRTDTGACTTSFCLALAAPTAGATVTLLVNEVPFRAPAQPRWSPDGSMVAFIYDSTAGGNYDSAIATVSATGGTPVEIVPFQGPTTGNFFPVFSPDGTRLAFLQGNVLQSGAQVMIATADGSDAQPIGVILHNTLGLDWQPLQVAPPPPPPPAAVVLTPRFTG